MSKTRPPCQAVLDKIDANANFAAPIALLKWQFFARHSMADERARNPLSPGGIVCNDRRVAVKGWIK